MSSVIAALLILGVTPAPEEQYNSPGTIGFLVTFGIAAFAVLLFVDMSRRIRRSRYREEIREKLGNEKKSL